MSPKTRGRVRIRAEAEREKAWSWPWSGAAKRLPMEGGDRLQKDIFLDYFFRRAPALAVWAKAQLWQASRVRKHIKSRLAASPFQW